MRSDILIGAAAPFEALADYSAAVEPLLVDTEQAASICGVSPASWFRLKAAGKTPAPVKLGGRVLYRVEDLKLWVALGCPDRKSFEAHKSANGRPR
jgi:predicted DNA-binding transcriptional regulator AlpA